MFRRTKRISFELSNLCNYARAHTACSAHLQSEPKILPEAVIDSALATCQAYSFAGVVSFHLYNEPAIDPRLCLFIRKAKEALPAAKLYLLTNGWYLDQNLAVELQRHGLDFLGISAYSQREYDRLERISLDIPVRVLFEPLDGRLAWNQSPPRPGPPRACYSPLYEICITSAADVCLCPFDWQRRLVFGNLLREPLDAILTAPRPWETYGALSQGRRDFAPCAECPTWRGEPHPEERPSR